MAVTLLPATPPLQPATSAPLASLPAGANAVCWSEDNLLAVATSRSVVLLSAAALDGPRAVIDVPFAQATNTEERLSAGLADHLRFAVTSEGRGGLRPEQRRHSSVRCVAWSPAGADAAGGCLLSVVTEDSRVLICGPPASSFSTRWQVLDDLTTRAQQDPTAAAMLAALEQAEAAAKGSEPLRLRGGGTRKREPAAAAAAAAGSAPAPSVSVSAAALAVSTATGTASDAVAFTTGSAVEVTNDEDGLRGCWFCGTITDMQRGFALVEYAELNIEEDSAERLQEWFPLQQPADAEAEAATAAEAEQLPLGAEAHTRRGFLLRPPPPPQMSQRGAARSTGDAVEAWHDGGWWQGHVASAPGAVAADSAAASADDAPASSPRRGTGRRKGHAPPAEDVPLRVLLAASGEELHVQQANLRTALNWDGAAWVHLPPAAIVAAAPAAAGGRSNVAADAASVQQQAARTQKGSKQLAVPQPYQVPEGFSAAELGSGALDASSKRAARQSAAEIFARRFAAVRSQLPADQRPTYEAPGQHLQGADAAIFERVRAEVAAVHGSALAAAGVTEKKWATEARTKLRRAWNRHTDPAMEQLTWEGAVEAAAPQDAKRPASQPEPYTVPADFDAAAALVECDLSDAAAARRALPWAFLQRWLALRDTVPEAQRPAYVKGQHLRGVDNDNAERCRAEIIHAHGEAMAALRLTEKWLVREGKALIRNRVIKTRFDGGLGGGDSATPEASPAPEVLPATRKRKAVMSAQAMAAAVSDDDGISGEKSASDYRGSSDAQPSSPSSEMAVEPEGNDDAAADEEGSGGDSGAAHAHVSGSRKRQRSQDAAQRLQMPLLPAARKFDAADVPRGPRPAPAQPRTQDAGATSATSQPRTTPRDGRSAGRPKSTSDGKQTPDAPPPALAALCAAWSPVFASAGADAAGNTAPAAAGSAGAAGDAAPNAGNNSRRAVLLAVGTAGGVVWLWRLRLPAAYTLQRAGPPDAQLVGVCRVAAACPVTAVSWAAAPASNGHPAALVLATGCADGSVKLFGADATQLGDSLCHTMVADSSSLQMLWPLGQAVPPDMRSVLSLAAACSPQLAEGGSWQLMVAAGKHAGVLALWHGRLLAETAELGLHPAGGTVAVVAHGSAPVTGVGIAAGCVTSCGADGGIARWNAATGAAVTEARQSSALQVAGGGPAGGAASGPTAGATGLALSPGGLFAAVVRTAHGVPASRRAGPNRRVQGTVELVCLGGGDVAPGGTAEVAEQLPWLRRATATAGKAAGTASGFGGEHAGSSWAAGSSEAHDGGFGSSKSFVDSVPPWSTVPPAAALWEAAAALAGVEAGRSKLLPRHGAGLLPAQPRLPAFAPRTPQQEDGEAPDGADAAPDQAAPPAAATSTAPAAEDGAAAALQSAAEALDAVLAPYESAATADGDGRDATVERASSRRCGSAAAALRHMLPHLQKGGAAASRLAALEAVLLQGGGAAQPADGGVAAPHHDSAVPDSAAAGWGCGACGRPCRVGVQMGASANAGTCAGVPQCPVCGLRAARPVPPTVLPEIGL